MKDLATVWRTHPALWALMREAYVPLCLAFEDGVGPVKLEVQQQDAEDWLLRVCVQVPADWPGDVEAALAKFDTVWWRGQCHRSGGRLVFDAERVS